MTLKNFCKCTLISGAVIIEGIKWEIRPLFHFSQPTNFLLGIAPNLLGTFLLPFGCYWFSTGISTCMMINNSGCFAWCLLDCS